MPIHIIILVCAPGTPIDKCWPDAAVLGAREGVEYVKILCVRDE